MKRILIPLILLVGTCLVSAQETEKSGVRAKADSLLETYSIEELLRYREYYGGQIKSLESETEELRDRGIKDAEHFIKNNPDSRILDKVIMRLAELYYQKSNDEYLEAMDKYDVMIEKQEEDGGPWTDIPEPQKDYEKVLSLYQKIINEFPQSDLYDDALYHHAFLLEDLGRMDEAVNAYNLLLTEFPSTRYKPDALLRIAEYHFNPPRNDIERAIELYSQILEFKDSPKYNEALYRLGWCYYRLNNYKQAVSYFTLLADDVERAESYDPTKRFTNPLLADESIEYIGISFLEQGGAKGAVDYLNSIGGRDYGIEILKKIGDVYKNEKEDYKNAINTYNLLLKLYPDNDEAPAIQEKIVESFRMMRDDMMAYLSRDKLYNDYKPGSPWWQNRTSDVIRESVDIVTERSLRDNINLLYQRAEGLNDPDLYLQAANDSRKYLKSFPSDTNAAQIHWNMALTMDTKLNDYEQAYDEYMRISDLYWHSKYQKFAAENAIALAKDAVAADTTTKTVATEEKDIIGMAESQSVLDAITYEKLDLTESEKKLARAYDNYIRLYPHETETADMLSNSGALYYNSNQFSEGLRYFNTFAKHFQDHPDIHYIRYMILESYFGKADFKSAEIVARKLKNDSEADSLLAEKAKKRLAESIFLAAEVFADSGNYLAAGNEHLRVVYEVPNAEFADLSLFRASLEFDKAKEYRRAIETYNFLIETKQNSKYKMDAMNNLAIDYGEVEEFKNAAITYERLAYTTKDSLKSHDALYNSSIFFVRAEEWEDAIRINRMFVNKYPGSGDADDLFFDIATYYLKLDQIDQANNIYGEYVQKYPNSPRVVETYFHRGEYFRQKGENQKAIAEYQNAVKKNIEFRENNIEPNDFFAAEAAFHLNKLKYDQYREIEFALPQAQMAQSKERKKEYLKELVEGFSNVVSYGTLRLYEATYYIGDTYEEFAEAWARQEIPPMDETRRIVYQKEINQTSADLYARAEKSYKQSVDVLTRLANNYETEIAEANRNVPDGETRLKVVAEDSTLRVARKWIDRCKEKISEVIYDIAELNFASVSSFLAAPIPPGLNAVSEMEYRKQVLNKAVKPLIDEIVSDHTRNIKEAWELGIENQWVKLSRSKIVSTNNILSDEYHALAFKSLDLYENNADLYDRVIRNEQSDATLDALSISDQMGNLIYYCKEFASLALEIERQTLDKAQLEGISDPVVDNTRQNMLRSIYELSDRGLELMNRSNANRRQFEQLFKDTDRIEYEDALFTYEDNSYLFRDLALELLELGHDTSLELDLQNRWSTEIILALVKTDPEKYNRLMNLTIDSDDLLSDESWLATTQYVNGWTESGFNDEKWKRVNFAEAAAGMDSKRIWIVAMDTLSIVSDTTIVPDSVQPDSSGVMTDGLDMNFLDEQGLIVSKPEIERVVSRQVFFRKSFHVEGLPVSAELTIKADDAYNLFFNGEYISAYSADSTEWRAGRSHQLGDYMKAGHNVLAIEGTDKDLSGNGIQVQVMLRSIADWDLQRQKFKIRASDEKVRQNLAVDKHIIIN